LVHESECRRAAIYCRVSTADQSCERQEHDLQEYAGRAGFDVVGTYKETGSGVKKVLEKNSERQKVMALAQARKIDAVLVTELTRWGRSTTDLIYTLQELEGFGVSLIAQSGLQLDLTTPQGRLFSTIMAGLAEFERDLLRERVRSGIAAAKARGQKFGRRPGYRPSDRLVPEVMRMVAEGHSQRKIAQEQNHSKTTVNAIIRRHSSLAEPEVVTSSQPG
jgi:DNA invertase Pin-like site-specific DNA recombinase